MSSCLKQTKTLTPGDIRGLLHKHGWRELTASKTLTVTAAAVGFQVTVIEGFRAWVDRKGHTQDTFKELDDDAIARMTEEFRAWLTASWPSVCTDINEFLRYYGHNRLDVYAWTVGGAYDHWDEYFYEPRTWQEKLRAGYTPRTIAVDLEDDLVPAFRAWVKARGYDYVDAALDSPSAEELARVTAEFKEWAVKQDDDGVAEVRAFMHVCGDKHKVDDPFHGMVRGAAYGFIDDFLE